MLNSYKRALLSGIAAATVSASFATTAIATDGYFTNGYGTVNKGMAGAGMALPADTQAAMKNPAGMAKIGSRFDGSIALFSPTREYSTQTPGGFIADAGEPSKSELFLVPSLGANWDMGDYSLGVTLSANGGMNTDYNTTVFNGGTSGKTGIDLAQAFLGLTYARQLNEKHSIGITPTLAAQRFKATGLQGFGSISSDSTRLTDNGYSYSYGYGARVGYLGEITDQVSIGAMAQSKMYMTKFDEYAGLFAEKGDFDIPATVSIGAAFKANDKLTIAADVQRIFYGSVKSIANTHNIDVTPFHTGAGGAENSNSLGNSDGMGFGWKDMDIIKVGVSYGYSDDVTVRAGVSHNSAAFSNTETLFNILAPAAVDTHLSVGSTYRIAPNMSLNLAYTHAFAANIEGINTNHIYGGAATPISLDMYQHDFEVGFSYEF